jgi:hypothetical protein
MERGASLDMTLQLSLSNMRGAHELRPSPLNVLHEIAIHKNAEFLDYMISSGYPLATMINSVAFDGNTPLHYLAITWTRDAHDTFYRLLSLGPDLNVTNNDLLRPIECFIHVGNLEAAQYLFNLGARPHNIQEAILSAVQVLPSHLSLSKSQDPSGWKHRWVRARNDFVLWLMHHAVETGDLTTRNVGENPGICAHWHRIFLIACTQPDLLKRLLIEGFKPSSLTCGYSLLMGLLDLLASSTTSSLDDEEVHSLYQALELIMRAGERWDKRAIPSQITPLQYVVKGTSSLSPDSRARLFKRLLSSRPPDETGAEQAHLDEMCQYALDRGDTRTYMLLVRNGAKDIRPRRHAGF